MYIVLYTTGGTPTYFFYFFFEYNIPKNEYTPYTYDVYDSTPGDLIVFCITKNALLNRTDCARVEWAMQMYV